MYDAKNPSQFSEEDCENAIGKRATLSLTGTIVEARTSDAGSYVMFEIDGRWGFSDDRPYQFGIDLDALELQPEDDSTATH